MHYAYDTAAWQNFYLCVGPAAAALIGLIFVAVSIRLGQVIPSPSWQGRALASISGLFRLLALALAVLLPGQPVQLLGIEITLYCSVNITWGLVQQRRRFQRIREPMRSRAIRLLVDTAAFAMVLGGLSLVFGRLGGLYWFPLPVLVVFFAAVYQAWQLLFAVESQPEVPAGRAHPLERT